MVSLPNPTRQRCPFWATAFYVAFLLSCSLIGLAPAGKAAPPPENSSGSSGPAASQFAITDFDGDNRPDLASVRLGQSSPQNARYWIDFQLTSGVPQTIGVTAPTGGLQLRARDVNGDSYPDVIVTTYWTNQPVAVLLNDGRGNFTPSDPSTFPGAFATSESSRISQPDSIKDATAALFSRYLPGEYEEYQGPPFPRVVAGRPVTNGFDFAALSSSGCFFGRAPPSLSLHR